MIELIFPDGSKRAFDKGASGRDVKILQCCHKVCKECWDEWAEVCAHDGQAPLCPVCRNQEFLVAIASAVSQSH
jgi:hypothetical protein